MDETYQPEEIKGDEEQYDVELAKSNSAVKEKKESTSLSDDFLEEGEGQLTIDVYQTPDAIVIESPIAGVNPDDLDVSITSESVTITGKRTREKKVSEEDYFYQECYWGKFSRSVILPQEVDAENAEASIKNGVLIVRMPKINRQKSKRLKVRLS